MDPNRQECFGLYGYGTGYYLKEKNDKALREHKDIPGFCDTCPKRNECWQEHRTMMEKTHPIETAAFIAAMDQAKASGDPQAGGRLAVRLASQGTPDPWMKGMFDNVDRGAKDRIEHDM